MRIAFVAPDDWTVWLFYRHLIAVLTELGAQITVFSAPGPYVSRLRDLGVLHQPVPYARFVSPLRDLRLLRSLRNALSLQAFDVVQNFTVKANLYGALAAAAAGVRTIINTVEGAGLLYSGVPNRRVRAIRALVESGLRHVRPRVSRYWFVNEHDRDLFVERRLATADQSVVAIATGVDTNQFDPDAVPRQAVEAFRAELMVPSHIPLVTMVAGRLLRSKGIVEFIAMARRLREAGVEAQAVLVGPEEPSHPDALPRSVVDAAVRERLVRWLPFREDIPTVYASSDVVVATMYYAEGTPKGVMEGMAMERAVVCSDLPSTRPLVTPGRDGLLVPPKAVPELTDAVAWLLQVPERREALGHEARQTAIVRLDADKAARAGVDAVYGTLPEWPPDRSGSG